MFSRSLHRIPASRCVFGKASSNYRSSALNPPPIAFGRASSSLSPRPQVQRSSVGSISLVTAAIVFAAGGSFYLYQYFVPTAKATEELYSFEMVGTLAPGRPGTLTSDQEVKLKEFWRQVFKVNGVPVEDKPVNGANGTNEENSVDDASVQEKDEDKKKKRRSLFTRKKKDSKSSADGQPDIASIGSEPADDKYGQTKEYKEALATNSPEELRSAMWSMVKHDHPDALLLRFLRARKWDIERALVMMISTLHWRSKEMHVDDDIVPKGEAAAAIDEKSADASLKREGKDFMDQLRLGKSFLHGVDREGRPMCTVRVRLHKQGEQTEASLERFTVHVIETARMILKPPVDTAAIVFDMTHFSMANMDYTPVKFMIKVFEANYPESLGVVLVHKAPWIFQGIWRIIRGWLDPVVAGKIHFTDNVQDLEAYIPPNQIIKELGGKEDWEYKYIEPEEDENDKLKDTETKERIQAERKKLVEQFEEATKEWLRSPPGDQESAKKRNDLAEELRKSYWNLDPYVRSKTWLDRSGVIKPGGVIDYYPEANKPDLKEEVAAGASAEHKADDVD